MSIKYKKIFLSRNVDFVNIEYCKILELLKLDIQIYFNDDIAKEWLLYNIDSLYGFLCQRRNSFNYKEGRI